MISHKPSAFAMADKILLLMNGQVADYGPRDEVMARIMPRQPQQAQRPQPEKPAKLTEVES
jgi:ABC-type protease/lipase transport system fused ATPase/permease subunit